MTAFEIKLNGKKLCTAGLRKFGDLGASLKLQHGPHVAKQTCFVHEFDLAELVVYGVNVRYKNKKAPHLKRGFRYDEHVEWVRRKFKPGDEITIRVIEVTSGDKPRKLRRLAQNDTLRAYKRQIRGVCEYFGWKVQT